jgi:hypothetical protein
MKPISSQAFFIFDTVSNFAATSEERRAEISTMGMEGWVEAEGLLPSREEAKDVFNGEPGRIRARRRAERRGTRKRGGGRGERGGSLLEERCGGLG